jgi:phage-related protein
VGHEEKPLVWLHGEVKTPPLSRDARRECGFLLRRLQWGELLSLPFSRPMPSIGARCHELRVNDATTRTTLRLIYRIDVEAVVILEVFQKTTRTTPRQVIECCQRRLRRYDAV